MKSTVASLAACAVLAACGPAKQVGRYPRQPDGCAVQLVSNPPTVPTDNIGTVRARCATDVSQDDCQRELKDQACRLGANIVWGVEDAPRRVDDKNEWSGRAAHSR